MRRRLIRVASYFMVLRWFFLAGMVVLAGCSERSASEVSTPFPNLSWESDAVDYSEASDAEIVDFQEETFAKDVQEGYSGLLALKGNVSIGTKACATSSDESPCIVSVARFYFDFPDNEAFRQFASEQENDSALSSSSLTLGCLNSEGTQIDYSTPQNAASGEVEWVEGSISGELFEALMATRDQSKKVTLWMEKPVLTVPTEWGDCGSYFKDFELFSE